MSGKKGQGSTGRGGVGGTGRSETSRGRRDDLPRRLGEVITPALDRLAGGDEARAYAAWARAVGDPVSAGTRPRAFRRGQLTIECASSVWANELTYLGPQILRRMDEVAPGHPVERFRFIIGNLPEPSPSREGAVADPGRSVRGSSPQRPCAGPSGQGSDPPTAKKDPRHRQPAADVQGAARAQAEGVDDERLRAAIQAALRRSSEEPPESSGSGAPSG